MRRAGRGSFSALQQYLEYDQLDRVRDDLVASWSGLVASHETAALEMEAVAQAAREHGKSRSLADPVYHVILSARPGEPLDVEQAKLSVDAVRRSLDASEHQYFAALHHDVDTDRYHVHLAINKVSVRDRMLDRWQDYAKLGRAAEWCEREMGLQVDRHVEWRSKLGERAFSLVPGIERELEPALAMAAGIDRQEGATIDRRDAVRRTHYSWVELLSREAVPAAAFAVAREGATWGDLHAVLRGYGVRLEPAGKRGAGRRARAWAACESLGCRARHSRSRGAAGCVSSAGARRAGVAAAGGFCSGIVAACGDVGWFTSRA